MDHGRILALDTPEGLKRLIPGGTMLDLRIRVPEMVAAGHIAEDGTESVQDEHFRAKLGRLPGVTKVEQTAGLTHDDSKSQTLTFRIHASEDAGALLANATQVVLQEQGELLDLHLARPSLEDVFIYLTGKGLRS
jgi:ABC-2 type transport system ATP-binding protein